jgi:hypothetical protein
LLLQAHAAVVLLLVAVLRHPALLLQLQGTLALQQLAGAGITTVVVGALALLVDPALLFLAGDALAPVGAFALFHAIALLGDPLRGQRLLVAPVLAQPLLTGVVLRDAGITLAARRSLPLLRKALFAALPFEALPIDALAGGRRTLSFGGALRGQALFGGLPVDLLSALDLLPGGLAAAFGILLLMALPILPQSVLLLARLRRTLLLLRGALVRGCGAALVCVVTLPGLRGACGRLRCRGLLPPLRRLLVILARIGLLLAVLLFFVLLLVLVARILARVGRGIEAGGQQGAERDGQQGALGEDVHGDPRGAAPWGRAQATACLWCTTSEIHLMTSEQNWMHSAPVGRRS